MFAREFASALARRGHEVSVLTPQRTRRFDSSGFSVHWIAWPGREGSLTHIDARSASGRARLASVLASGTVTTTLKFGFRRVDHVLALWALPSGLFAAAARLVGGTPFSVWALGSDIWRASDYPAGRKLLGLVLHHAQHRFADGLGLAADVERAGGLPCEFMPTSRRLPVAPPMQLDDGRTHFLCVARFHPNKGVDVLLEAVSLLPEDVRAGSVVHVFGGGPESGRLQDAARRMGIGGTVQLNGYIGPVELVAYLQSVRSLIIPSRIESIPVILSDAAQADCPVIATDVGDVGDLVRRFGTGSVIPPASSPALAAAITGAYRNPPERTGSGTALARFLSLERSVDLFLERVEGRPRPAAPV